MMRADEPHGDVAAYLARLQLAGGERERVAQALTEHPGTPAFAALHGELAHAAEPPAEPVRLYVVRSRSGGKWAVKIHPARGERPVSVTFERPPERVVVSVLDRAGVESEPATLGE